MQKQFLRYVIALSLALGISTLGFAKDDDDVNGKKFEQLSAEINALSAQLSAFGAQLVLFNAQFSLLSAEVGAIGSQVTGLNSQLGALSSQVGGLNSQVGSLNSQVGSLNARVAALEADGTGGDGSTAPAVVNVNCSAGETIASALTNAGVPLTINVTGICNENITINRDDVTLMGAAGGEIHGTSTAATTINVFADRVTIDGLTVTGGANGIAVLGGTRFALRNCNVGPTGGIGVLFYLGSQSGMDNCTVHNNPGEGVTVQAAVVSITNSTITDNGRAGMLITNTGTARVGINAAGVVGGNTISNNGGNGVQISFSAAAYFASNTITGNGKTGVGGRSGINLFSATADFFAGNTISKNSGTGVSLTSSSILLGDSGFGTTQNVISENGGFGISANNGSSITSNIPIIEANTAGGVSLSLNSSAQLGGTIRNNTNSGLLMQTASTAIVSASITGNTGWGILCVGPETSVSAGGGVGTNGLGGVSPDCTGF